MNDNTNSTQNINNTNTNKIGFDLNAREELIRTYTEKEIDLM